EFQQCTRFHDKPRMGRSESYLHISEACGGAAFKQQNMSIEAQSTRCRQSVEDVRNTASQRNGSSSSTDRSLENCLSHSQTTRIEQSSRRGEEFFQLISAVDDGLDAGHRTIDSKDII